MVKIEIFIQTTRIIFVQLPDFGKIVFLNCLLKRRKIRIQSISTHNRFVIVIIIVVIAIIFYLRILEVIVFHKRRCLQRHRLNGGHGGFTIQFTANASAS